ncbi:L,D-transpeptidase family protein [Actinokineospora auranticolor]|uniref:L,D-peptidoglycan transpeptidase YkuD (ErfK/YbiS/YcfS/YnhG family) n=1 Tax=Actinokineospora auranticolor TaxID=155976 RepID=A0A2S6GCN2_9PSEU|nr:L,D-transpeptidase family protein [Actinokineospora auranticolor]PPK62743.1 L,D-peptidoglycan transpeptidase YkuD (ErfK/YbiS/YcfS/YnhG family) [Actinokineospora auranticolor]
MRSRVAAFAVCALVAGSGTAAAEGLPLPYSGPADQVVTVVAANPAATTATVTAWRRAASGWTVDVGPVDAFVGESGIGQTAEGRRTTPAGVWPLTEAFGNKPGYGTRLPYRQVDTSDWWVSDVDSPHYNKPFRCAPGACPFDERAGEDLGRVGAAYDRAVVIDYNRDPVVAGAGSAFFLHIGTGAPTAGCVSVPAPALDSLLTWLDPGAHPVIAIGVP